MTDPLPTGDVLEYQPLSGEGAGVFYRAVDFPGVFVRAVVSTVDLVVLLFLVAGWSWFVVLAGLQNVGSLGTFVVAWSYLVLAKRYRATVGYAVFGIKAVDLSGRPAGLVRLSFRTGVAVILNPVVDLLWAGSDGRSRQALRDKLSGTYVVWNDARPAGMGQIVLASVFLLGWNFVYREVKRPGLRDGMT